MLALLFIVVFDIKFEACIVVFFRWQQSLSVFVPVYVYGLCRLRSHVWREKKATCISGAWSKLASTGYLYWFRTTFVIRGDPTVVVIGVNLQACVCLCVLAMFAQSHALINTSTIARRQGSYTQHHQRAVHAQRAPASRRFDKRWRERGIRTRRCRRLTTKKGG